MKAFRDRYRLKPVLTLVFNLIVPLVAIMLIELQYPHLGRDRFTRTIIWIVPAGLVLLGISLLQERWQKGTRQRLGLDAAYVAGSIVWLFGLLGGSTTVENTYDAYRFTLDVTPLVVVIISATGLNFVHDVLEYLHYAGRRPRRIATPAAVHAARPG